MNIGPGKNEHNTYAIYQQLLRAGKRILVYSGDVDNCLPWTGSLQWVELLGASLMPQETWRPWTLAGGTRVGGYVVQFGEHLQFATVRGAGHMVPEFRPVEAFVLIDRWLAGEPLPAYVKSQGSIRQAL